VLYRAFARRNARRYGLVGRVENLPDGTVFVLAQGDESALHHFIEDLERGNMFSRVDGVEVKWSSAEQAFSDFQIKYRDLSDHL